MLDRENLIAAIHQEVRGEDSTFVAVDLTVRTILEYVDDAIIRYGIYPDPAIGQVLKMLKANVKQLGSDA